MPAAWLIWAAIWTYAEEEMANEELTIVFAGTELVVSGLPLPETPLLPAAAFVEAVVAAPVDPVVAAPVDPVAAAPVDPVVVGSADPVVGAVPALVAESASRPLDKPPPLPPPPPPHPASAPAAAVSKIALLCRTFNKKNLRDSKWGVCTWERSYRANVLAFSFPMYFTLPRLVLHP
jgi:hypothetical protein